MGNCVSAARQEEIGAPDVQAPIASRNSVLRTSATGFELGTPRAGRTRSAIMDLSTSAREGAAVLLRRGNTEGMEEMSALLSPPGHHRTSVPRSTRVSPLAGAEDMGYQSPRSRSSVPRSTRVSPLTAQLAVAAATSGGGAPPPHSTHDSRSSASYNPHMQLPTRSSLATRSSLQERVPWSEPGMMEEGGPPSNMPMHSSSSYAYPPGAHVGMMPAYQMPMAGPYGRALQGSGGGVAAAVLMTQLELARAAHAASLHSSREPATSSPHVTGRRASQGPTSLPRLATPFAQAVQGDSGGGAVGDSVGAGTGRGIYPQTARAQVGGVGIGVGAPEDYFTGLAASEGGETVQMSEVASSSGLASMPLRVRVPGGVPTDHSSGGGSVHTPSAGSQPTTLAPPSTHTTTAASSAHAHTTGVPAPSVHAARSRIGLEALGVHSHGTPMGAQGAPAASAVPAHELSVPPAAVPPPPVLVPVTVEASVAPRSTSFALRVTGPSGASTGSGGGAERERPLAPGAAGSGTEGQSSLAATLLAKPWATRSAAKSLGGYSEAAENDSCGSKPHSGSIHSGSSPGFFRVTGTLPRRTRSTQGGVQRRGTSTGGYASTAGGGAGTQGAPSPRSSHAGDVVPALSMSGSTNRSSGGAAPGGLAAAALVAALPGLATAAPMYASSGMDTGEAAARAQLGGMSEGMVGLGLDGDEEEEWNIPPLADSAMPTPVGSMRTSPAALMAGGTVAPHSLATTQLVSALAAVRSHVTTAAAPTGTTTNTSSIAAADRDAASGAQARRAGTRQRRPLRIDSASQLEVERPSPVEADSMLAEGAGEQAGGVAAADDVELQVTSTDRVVSAGGSSEGRLRRSMTPAAASTDSASTSGLPPQGGSSTGSSVSAAMQLARLREAAVTRAHALGIHPHPPSNPSGPVVGNASPRHHLRTMPTRAGTMYPSDWSGQPGSSGSGGQSSTAPVLPASQQLPLAMLQEVQVAPRYMAEGHPYEVSGGSTSGQRSQRQHRAHAQRQGLEQHDMGHEADEEGEAEDEYLMPQDLEHDQPSRGSAAQRRSPASTHVNVGQGSGFAPMVHAAWGQHGSGAAAALAANIRLGSVGGMPSDFEMSTESGARSSGLGAQEGRDALSAAVEEACATLALPLVAQQTSVAGASTVAAWPAASALNPQHMLGSAPTQLQRQPTGSSPAAAHSMFGISPESSDPSLSQRPAYHGLAAGQAPGPSPAPQRPPHQRELPLPAPMATRAVPTPITHTHAQAVTQQVRTATPGTATTTASSSSPSPRTSRPQSIGNAVSAALAAMLGLGGSGRASGNSSATGTGSGRTATVSTPAGGPTVVVTSTGMLTGTPGQGLSSRVASAAHPLSPSALLASGEDFPPGPQLYAYEVAGSSSTSPSPPPPSAAGTPRQGYVMHPMHRSPSAQQFTAGGVPLSAAMPQGSSAATAAVARRTSGPLPVGGVPSQRPPMHRLLSARVQASPRMVAALQPERATWAGSLRVPHPLASNHPAMQEFYLAQPVASTEVMYSGLGSTPSGGSTLAPAMPWRGPGSEHAATSGSTVDGRPSTSRSYVMSVIPASPGSVAGGPLTRWASAMPAGLGVGVDRQASLVATSSAVPRASMGGMAATPRAGLVRAASMSVVSPGHTVGPTGGVRGMLADTSVSGATAQAAASKVKAVALELQSAHIAMAVAAQCGEQVPELAQSAVSGTLSHLHAELSYEHGSSLAEGEPLLLDSTTSAGLHAAYSQHNLSGMAHGGAQQQLRVGRPQSLDAQSLNLSLMPPEAVRAGSGSGAYSSSMGPGSALRGRLSRSVTYEEGLGSGTFVTVQQQPRGSAGGRSSGRGQGGAGGGGGGTGGDGNSGPLLTLDLPLAGSWHPAAAMLPSDQPPTSPAGDLLAGDVMYYMGAHQQRATPGDRTGSPAAGSISTLLGLSPVSTDLVQPSDQPLHGTGSGRGVLALQSSVSPRLSGGQSPGARSPGARARSASGGSVRRTPYAGASTAPNPANILSAAAVTAAAQYAGGGSHPTPFGYAPPTLWDSAPVTRSHTQGSTSALADPAPAPGSGTGLQAPRGGAASAGGPRPSTGQMAAMHHRSSAPPLAAWPGSAAPTGQRGSTPGNLAQLAYEYGVASGGGAVAPGGLPLHPAASQPLPPRRDEHEALALSFFRPSPRSTASAAAAVAPGPSPLGSDAGGSAGSGEGHSGRSSAPGWMGAGGGLQVRGSTGPRYALDQVPEGEVSSSGLSSNPSYTRVSPGSP